MTSLSFALFFIVGIACTAIDSISISNLRNYLQERYPSEWKDFVAAKPRLFLPGRGRQRWNWNIGAIGRFVAGAPILSTDQNLSKRIRWIKGFRIIFVIFVVIFVGLFVVLNGV